MKKLFIFLAFILLITSPVPAFAEEDDWGGVYDSYKDAEMGKPVSQQEYENAIKSLEKLQKKDKKEKAEKEPVDKKMPEPAFVIPSRQEPLFTLATDVTYNGQVIKKGFYLVSAINKDDKHFIRLTQGEGRIIADIEANVFKNENTEIKIFSEILKNDILKVTYTNENLILEAYLWIQ